MSRIAEDVLRRNRGVTIIALAVLAVIAWVWVVAGAGMGMAAQAEFVLFPHRSPALGMAMPWHFERALLGLAMWWVMMIAMMIPAAAPVILLYARSAPQPRTAAFLAGYLLCWLAFSVAAVAIQASLEGAGRVTSMGMALTSKWWAGSVLIAAGLYQFSPVKSACLSHCRNPALWLSSHYRPGAVGALRMGISHGSYCVGCCWMLMALLFVGGVMNLVWVAALTLIVAAEKLLPGGRRIAVAAGSVLIAWGIAILLFG